MEQETTRTLDITAPALPASVACPHCQKSLVTTEIKPTEQIRCSGCCTSFYRPGTEPRKKVSGKAVFSLILGLFSPLGSLLTAIPAILLGLLAVRDIRRNAQLRGMPLAVGGIISGGFFLLACGGLLLGIIFLISSFQLTDDPATVRSRASERFAFDLPAGVGPKSAQQILGIEEFQFSGKQPATHIVATFHPNTALLNAQDQLKQTRANIPGTLIANEEIGRSTASILKQTTQINENFQLRRYSKVFEGASGYLIVVVSVRDNAAENNKPLVDQQVVSFFESIKLTE